MSVTKRIRYEVLRRDNSTCQYCGKKAPDTELHVDHVIPAALGGSDKPSNLVAACVDCNAGKGAANPDNALVERLSAEAATYALEMANKSASLAQRLSDEKAYLDRFYNHWANNIEIGPLCIDSDWKATLRRWHRQGLPIELVEHAVDVTAEKKNRGDTLLLHEHQFRYMAGVIYRTLEQEDVAFTLGDHKVRLYTEQEYEAHHLAGYMDGAHDWTAQTEAKAQYTDPLARHIDKGLALDAYRPHDLSCIDWDPAALARWEAA